MTDGLRTTDLRLVDLVKDLIVNGPEGTGRIPMGRFLELIRAGGVSGLVSPLDFGAPANGEDPAAVYLQATIDAVAEGARSGIVWIDRPFALEATVHLRPGVVLMGNGSFNRRSFPNSFNGVRLYPHDSAPEGLALLGAGAAGQMDDNPNGAYLQGLALDGRRAGGEHHRGCVGLLIRDTSDVRSFNSYFGGFDRTDNTGFCAIVEGTGEGNCFGTTFDQCVFSNAQHGVFYTGLGTTDMRHANNLYVGVTRALTLGYDDRPSTVAEHGGIRQEGGAGMQIVNDHYTYTGMPSPGWFIRSGGQGGSLMIANTYFDQHGGAQPIRLGNSKAKLSNCHFLCAREQSQNGLVRVQTAGSQQLVFTHNTIDLNGCDLKAMIEYSAKAGIPTGGVVSQNEVYGSGPAWRGAAINQTGEVIPDTDNGAFLLAQNVRCP
ncbi:hypothetical protein [Salipiger abyssi]|uniref:hypothetical protein n=1 Tax=Salipiger abyssi TaxID=1250539 RepID=UPI00405984D5